MSEEPHSAAYFGPQRDLWWNHDQLELIGRRLALHEVRSVLDVGSGVGHWGRLIGSLVAPGASVVGVEREPRWVEEATRQAPPGFTYVQGVAERLPFADGTFDLVTCQTLLIHLPDPRAGLREMLRVTRPGGQVVVAEPNNRASLVVDTSAGADIVDALAFAYTCERGKIALGEGNNSLGDLVPGYLAHEGLTDIATWLCDKPATLFPPYASEEQRIFADSTVSEASRPFGWTRAQAERYHRAGGGTDFDAAWGRRLAEARAAAEAVQAGTFHSAGGMLLYLVAGRKPTSLAHGYLQ